MSADASLDHPEWTIQSERDVQLMGQINLSNPAECQQDAYSWSRFVKVLSHPGPMNGNYLDKCSFCPLLSRSVICPPHVSDSYHFAQRDYGGLSCISYPVNIPNLIPSFFHEQQANRELVLVRQGYEKRAGSWIS
jgi:hypothetical protein